jgi:hypothetical protein
LTFHGQLALNGMQLQIIQERIFEIRGNRVMLDFHLAEMYEVETKALKQAVRRNIKRFPKDFMFELTQQEHESLRSQLVTLKKSGRGQHSKYKPYAFTEQGIAMLSAVLNSPKAIDVSLSIMRAFVMLRQYLMDYSELKSQIETLEKEMNRKFKDIYEALNYLLTPSVKERKPIGFKSNRTRK